VDDVIPLMASGKVLPYLDVPLQHSHPDVLRRMKRPASGERNLERIQQWRAACPEIVVRSTFIAGFPGETEEEFGHLLDFVRAAQIDRAGCFAYSPVEGAAANALPGMLPAELREERRARFMAVAEEVSAQRLQSVVWAPPCRCWWMPPPAWAARAEPGAVMPMHPRSTAWCACCPPRKSARPSRSVISRRRRIVGHPRATIWWRCRFEPGNCRPQIGKEKAAV
jgi:ribosomal protein S12 methylthiotransferase